MIYEKAGIAKPMHTRYHQMFEYMFVLSKEKPKTFNPLKDKVNNDYGSISGSITMRDTDGSLFDRPEVKIGLFGMRGNIWKYNSAAHNSDKISSQHPARFPIELVGDHVKSWTNNNEIVLDPFLGSGTALIACEQNDRICYGIEISPLFVELAIKRWEAYTNKKAELLGKG